MCLRTFYLDATGDLRQSLREKLVRKLRRSWRLEVGGNNRLTSSLERHARRTGLWQAGAILEFQTAGVAGTVFGSRETSVEKVVVDYGQKLCYDNWCERPYALDAALRPFPLC